MRGKDREEVRVQRWRQMGMVSWTVLKDSGFYTDWDHPITGGCWAEDWPILTYPLTASCGCSIEMWLKGCTGGTVKPHRRVLKWLLKQDGSHGGVGGLEKSEDSGYILKVEWTWFLDWLNVSCERKRRVQNDWSFGLSSWKDKAVINRDGEECMRWQLWEERNIRSSAVEILSLIC